MNKISNPSQRTLIVHSCQTQHIEKPRSCSANTETRAKLFAIIETTQCDPSFETLLAEAVDEALSSLGNISKQAIYFYLERAFSIRKRDISYRIDDFANAIEKIFGIGAKLLEIRIMQRLYEKTGPSFKYFPNGKDLIFTEYVNAAKNEFDENSENAEAETTKLPSKTQTLSWEERILKLA